jgi:hypothetical protein
MKKTAKETTKFLNSSSKEQDSIKVFKDIPGFKYDYERLFIEHECSACKETIAQLDNRFIRDNEHQHIECIICSCNKRLVAKELEVDTIMRCSCGLTYKLIKINNVY